MSKIRSVIFDCYSTLIDIKTDEGKNEVFQYLSLYLQYYGASMSAARLESQIREEKKRCLASTKERYPEVDLEMVFRSILKKERLNNAFLAQSCCKLLRLVSRERLELFPDSIGVLKDVRERGYSTAIVSDAQKVFCLDEMRMLGLDGFFDHIVISTHFGFQKPDPRLFLVACDLLGVAPAQAVYIGNHPEKDIGGAKQTGMRAILVDRNKGANDLTVEPDFRAASLWEAWEWIRRLS